MESVVEYYSAPYLNNSHDARTHDVDEDEDDDVESGNDIDPSIIAPDGLARRIRRDTLVNPPDVDIKRTALTVARKQGEFNYAKHSKPALCESIRQDFRKNCTGRRLRDYLYFRIPMLNWFFHYNVKRDLYGDVISGITGAVMQVPQGLAFGLLALFHPILGLYTSSLSVLVYAALASSKHNSLGTFIVVCMVARKVILVVATFPEEAVAGVPLFADNSTTTFSPTEVASILSFSVAAWMLTLAFFELGFLYGFVSEMMGSAFTTGVALHVLTSQIPELFGMPPKIYLRTFNLPKTWYHLISNVAYSNPATLIVSSVCIFVLAINNEVLQPRLRKITRIPVPIELIVLIGGTLASTYVDLNENFEVKVVGAIPTGLPAPTIPTFELFGRVIIPGLTITIATFSADFSFAKFFARKHNYNVDVNQELYAMGFGNLCGAVFACGPLGASMPRSQIQQAVGGTTQLASFVSCAILLCALFFIGPLFETLPTSVLSAIMTVALKGLLVQVGDFPRMWKKSRLDAMQWLITFLTVVIVDMDIGLLTGILASLFLLLVQNQSPRITLLGRISDTDIFLDQSKYSKAEEVAGIKICSVFGNLHFANQDSFRNNLIQTTGLDPPTIRKWTQKQEKSLKMKRKHSVNAKTSTENGLKSVQKNDITHVKENWMKSTEIILNSDQLQAHFSDLTSNLHSSKAVHDLVSLVVDFSAVSRMDVYAARNLAALYKEYEAVGVVVAFTSLSESCLEVMSKCGASDDLAEEVFFHSVEDAVVFLTTPENTVPEATTHI